MQISSEIRTGNHPPGGVPLGSGRMGVPATEGWALLPHPLSPTQQGLPSFLILPMYQSSYFTVGLKFSRKTKSDSMHSLCATLWSMLMSVTADAGGQEMV